MFYRLVQLLCKTSVATLLNKVLNFVSEMRRCRYAFLLKNILHAYTLTRVMHLRLDGNLNLKSLC